MATRRLEREGWAEAVSRLASWRPEDLAVCWAMVRESKDEPWTMLGITVRGGTNVPERDFEYSNLKLQSRMLRGPDIANRLKTGHVTRPLGEREFREVAAAEGIAYWLTSRTVWGMTGPLPTPSYYYSVQLIDQQLITRGRLQEPAYGPGQLYYPTGDDALLDVLFGVTRHQGRRDLVNQVVIHLPYEDARIESVGYVDGQGAVVTVAEGSQGWASGHELQALWQIHLSETSYQRGGRAITHAGPVTFSVGAEPAYFAASLQNEEGLLVDYIERLARAEAAAESAPLPSDALPEAFDFLASVWLNVLTSAFPAISDKHLFQVRRVSPAARLTTPVATRADFASRMSDLADVLKAIKIDDSFIEPKLAKDLTQDKSLGRLKVAVKKLLKSPDLDGATRAIDVLQDIVRVRAALQHEEKAEPDLPTALARLSIKYPPEWPQAWEAIRRRAVGALRDLRQALESAQP
jgi:hypothetical protein